MSTARTFCGMYLLASSAALALGQCTFSQSRNAVTAYFFDHGVAPFAKLPRNESCGLSFFKR
ncbi:hypothetical protein [Cupriavidus basilensis]|uniref:hypothetical protein n=1 Tax=Cupriavidus basilensis TaxID=68895 RepID=UPI0023E896F0|nr:hypothetical protein [Cupriavidus basilensis]MDF3881126.1 hypothetical protein [Cupriavidus basilensis]